MFFTVSKLFRNCGLRYSSWMLTRPQIPKLGFNQRWYGQSAPSQNVMKVTIIGAAGNTGRPLALMLKQCQLIDEICLHDIESTKGIASELSYIDTKCKVTSMEHIKYAVRDAQVIVVVAAKADSSYLEYENMFEYNAPIIKEIVKKIAKYNNKAFLAICTNPINSLVPMACEIMKKNGYYNPKTIFGVTALDCVRANTLAAEVMGIPPECVNVPVVGGNTEHTLVPILSKAEPCAEFTNEELEEITLSIKKGHQIIVKVKRNQGAHLAAAFAVARFVISLVKAQQGVTNLIECAFVKSQDLRVKYLATPVLLGTAGITRNLGVPELSDYEKCQLDNAVEMLRADIRQGEHYVGVVSPPSCDECDPNPNAPRCPPDHCEIQDNLMKQ